jgi:hypothetical protein
MYCIHAANLDARSRGGYCATHFGSPFCMYSSQVKLRFAVLSWEAQPNESVAMIPCMIRLDLPNNAQSDWGSAGLSQSPLVDSCPM